MTNKHKKGGSSSTKAAAKAATKAARRVAESDSGDVLQSSSQAQQPSKNFTTAQLTTLVLLTLGLTKITDLSKAIGQLRITQDHDQQSPVCSSWFVGDSANHPCSEDGFVSLVMLKYQTSIQMALITASIVWHTWKTESLLQRFVSLLIACPVFTTASFVLYKHGSVFQWPVVKQHLALCLILAYFASPSSREGYPFVKIPTSRIKESLYTMQAWALIALAVGTAAGAVGTLLSDSPVSAAAGAVAMGCRLDKVAMALMYAYAFVHFPNEQQRTFLLSVAAIKAVEVFSHLPALEHVWPNVDNTRYMLVGTAVLAAVACFVPNLVFVEGTEQRVSSKKKA